MCTASEAISACEKGDDSSGRAAGSQVEDSQEHWAGEGGAHDAISACEKGVGGSAEMVAISAWHDDGCSRESREPRQLLAPMHSEAKRLKVGGTISVCEKGVGDDCSRKSCEPRQLSAPTHSGAKRAKFHSDDAAISACGEGGDDAKPDDVAIRQQGRR